MKKIVLFYFIFYFIPLFTTAGQYDTNGKCVGCPIGWKRSESDTPLTECKQCKIGETTCLTQTGGKCEEPGENATSCAQCDLGRFGFKKGTCGICKAGRYQDGKGVDHCKACAVDTYTPDEGKKSKAECLACPSERTTGNGINATSVEQCVCKRDDYYQDHINNTCISCPIGAKCNRNGIKLLNVFPDAGYWRANNKTDVFTDCASAFPSDPEAQKNARDRCCAINATTKISTCAELSFENQNEQCIDGYIGPLCAGCSPNYVQIGRDCVRCSGGSDLETVFHAVGIVVAVFYTSCCCILFCCVKKDKRHTDANSVEVGKISGKGQLMGNLKIFIMFGQLLSSMPVAFDGVPWPSEFISLLSRFSLFLDP